VAVATLLLWLCTAAVGAYLLVTSVHSAHAAPDPEEAEPEPEESVTVPAEQAATASADPASAAASPVQGRKRPALPKDLFDPPSLRRAKSEPMPGLRELAEFAHPALAMIGIGVWLGYVVSRDRVFAAIGLGILLGAIGAGLSWFIANTRAARRAAANADSGDVRPGSAPLSPAPRLLILHAAGAALTLLFAILIAVRV
jgi:pyruvate/2-oxoglutarate dehydrogenase complex dihydrolipoamide acyltransferase (E2) component